MGAVRRSNPELIQKAVNRLLEHWIVPGSLDATIGFKRRRTKPKRVRVVTAMHLDRQELEGVEFGIDEQGHPVGTPTIYRSVAPARKAIKAFVKREYPGRVKVISGRVREEFVIPPMPYTVEKRIFYDPEAAYWAAKERADAGAPFRATDADGEKLSLLDIRMALKRLGPMKRVRRKKKTVLISRRTGTGRRGARRAARRLSLGFEPPSDTSFDFGPAPPDASFDFGRKPKKRKLKRAKACVPGRGVFVRSYTVPEHWRKCPERRPR
ncbi:MAG: hypothetical protein Q8R92_13040 [Deltaproteobacteria bacterium]|nr:hypothetical protein [Deltaproteobacteria bacterium]